MAGRWSDGRKEWACSSDYESTAYALSMCPFKRSTCGPNINLNFYDVGDDGAIHIKNLDKGETCVYNVESVCGAPSFKIANSTGVYAWFIDYQNDRIETSLPLLEKNPNDAELRKASPLAGMPIRSTNLQPVTNEINSGEALFGAYEKNGFKAWGNKLQDGSEKANVGRRYSSKD